MRVLVPAIALLAFAACERSKAPQAPQPAAPAIAVTEVAAADAYGVPSERVNAVAFWSDPGVNFQGLVIAATESGIKAFNIESGTLVAESPVKATGLTVIYDGQGAAAQGYIVALVDDAVAVIEIDNATKALKRVATAGETNAKSVCAGRQGDGNAIYEVNSSGLSSRTLTPGATQFIGEAKPIIAARGLISCHVDDRNGAVIAIGDDGAVRRIDPYTGESFGIAMIEGLIADSSAILLSTAAGDEPKNGGAIAILDGKSGLIRLLDLIDGHALGMVRVKSTFDLEAVASATAIAAGYGNYGGVYRDGALAVVAMPSDAAPIRLVPWNGVLSALQLPLGEPVDPRAPSPALEDEGVIDIEFVEP
ncbi:MAG: hypothetical protein HXY21_03910 [Parvularculaceae bacterium]|nr:hypothetical protein [Parvularculaceae bacterium]